MLGRLFRKRKGSGTEDTSRQRMEPQPGTPSEAVELKGRKVRRVVEPVIGSSILELAERNRVDWLSNCRRGTCARCRCLVEEGMELLNGPTEAEKARLEREELEAGYRLGCQARLIGPGKVVVRHAPYF